MFKSHSISCILYKKLHLKIFFIVHQSKNIFAVHLPPSGHHWLPSAYLGHRRLSEVGLQDGDSGLVIRQGNVDQLIKTTRSQDGGVNDVWSIQNRAFIV